MEDLVAENAEVDLWEQHVLAVEASFSLLPQWMQRLGNPLVHPADVSGTPFSNLAQLFQQLEGVGLMGPLWTNATPQPEPPLN